MERQPTVEPESRRQAPSTVEVGRTPLSARLDAAAFTLGNHVAFHRGAFAPGTEDGLRLLAHEMVHVVQWQNGGRRAPQASDETAAWGPSLEREARAAVDVAARGTVARVHQAVGSAMPLSHPVYMNAYRDTMLLASAIVAGFGGPATSERDFVLLRESIRQATRGWTWTAPTGQAAIEAQLTGSPTLVINRVLRSRFFDDLDAVRGKMTSSTWLEIQGCRAGQDPDYLVQMQAFFARGDVRPKVSAPDWYQFFGHYGFTPVADTPAALQAQWDRPQVRAALAYWYPVLTGGALPDAPTRDTLGEFLRALHALPMAIPGSPGEGIVLVLEDMRTEAFLEWLSRHSYRLTSVDEIRRALFTEGTFAANVVHSVIDWLQENRTAPTQIAFRFDPTYDAHIVKV